MTEPEELMTVARALAAEAGALVREGRAQAEVAHTKSSAIDIVTQMDLASEQLIRRRLGQWRPDDAIKGEEGEDSPGVSGVTWVVDPIDGTVNYLYGLPHYAVSVAAVRGPADPQQWELVAGAVWCGDGTLWSAARGAGAFSGDRPMRRHQFPPLSETLLATGFQYQADRRVRQGRTVAQMVGQVRDIRRLGAAAVDLCLVAEGKLDGYYEKGLHPWDFAAGALIAQEAGVMVAGLDAGPASEELTIAAGPDVWHELHNALIDAGAGNRWDSPTV